MNVTVTGLSNYQLKNLTASPVGLLLNFEVLHPQLNFTGLHSTNGTLDGSFFSGNGHFNATATSKILHIQIFLFTS